ncbi:hypothetical protein SLNSH_06160 [Alsobacter soli]|uniref:Uncharacterized protein n=1 Tax=Alsobacter soli TaxID=2109933 RepID=A0A2T1HW92_9HYPH|nr:hypothetical protein [Alsobacter soli]PSC05956.1 hypothetical protein SLNSH_06160 [Alsobacter soli]
MGNAAGSVGGAVGGVSGAVGGAVGNAAGAVSGVSGSVGGAVSGAVGGVTGAVGGAVSGVTGSVSGVASGATGSVSATGSAPGSSGSVAAAAARDAQGFVPVGVDDSHGGDIVLPRRLLPSEATRGGGRRMVLASVGNLGWVRGDPDAVSSLGRAMSPSGNVPTGTVSACRAAVARAAKRYGAVAVEAVGSGERERAGQGWVAPLRMRVLYARAGGYEVRQSAVRCRLDARGIVTGAS